ncbi:Phosphate/phosphite/phosphonate ABC transporter, periplasmic binding protein [Acididesulfobacillus acetoxydans]|uniref:Phosphate/phosphite/phosphonate ABC transporter, periplasmic binding protein n=1 Tax=Acididesulfobacillus acetoxydans TaxID=1561005 RepID=A0A8S0WNT0_9FIRM|nr:phosphate/phosphite/phosphonate ABC transporter substrate-binding protein [Acididesulfobacillus acetoxydans]CAA7601464.1 Phosphate/phosphite/phosphonate ABC transporter, periplasmic binding protein [Acididesulfobacillus acetoxydans]CEJ06119.1 Phosphonate ABC transporter, periplasmic phosphonate-binding protein [Acididesulfobacillus acetoxydans]
MARTKERGQTPKTTRFRVCQRKFALLALLLLLSSFLLTACSQGPALPWVSLQGPMSIASRTGKATRQDPVRVVLASITSPQESRVYYDAMLNYLGRQLGRPIDIIQRKTYAEANDLVRAGSADVAFVCTYAYVAGHAEFGMELLAAPVIHGQTTYHADVIVNKNSSITSFSQLRGKVFAFTDPMSNTGTMYPLSLVKALGSTPDEFFAKYFYTYSHDYAILAVADGLADGASVDSTVYDYLRSSSPASVAKVRVIRVSPPYGMPPIVVRADLDPQLKKKIQMILLRMNENSSGRKILAKLHIQRFVTVKDSLYDSVRALAKAAGAP